MLNYLILLAITLFSLWYIKFHFYQYVVDIVRFYRNLKSFSGPGISQSIWLNLSIIIKNFKNPKTVAMENYGLIKNLCDSYGQTNGMAKFWTGFFPPWIFVCDPRIAQTILSHEGSLDKADMYKPIKYTVAGDGLLTCDYSKVSENRKHFSQYFRLKLLDSYIDSWKINFEIFKLKTELIIENQFGHFDYIKTYVSTLFLDNLGDNLFNIKFNSQQYGEPAYIKSADALMEYFDLLFFRPWKYFFNNRFLFYFTALFDDAIVQNVRLIGHLVTIYASILNIIKTKFIKLLFTPESGIDNRKTLFDSIFESRLSQRNWPLFSGIIDMISQTVTFLFVGHDTTTTTCTWMMNFLAHHTAIQEKLCSEVDAFLASEVEPNYFSLKKLKYAECVIKETLRLVPVSPYLGRRVTKPIIIDEKTTLTPGTNVVIVVNYINQNEKIYKNPQQFSPERFQTNSNFDEAFEKHSAFFPFSTGPRSCLGKDYAMMQLKLFLVLFFARYRVEPIDGDKIVTPCYNVVQRPATYSVKLYRR